MRPSARGESALLLIDLLHVLRVKSVKYAVVGAMAGLYKASSVPARMSTREKTS